MQPDYYAYMRSPEWFARRESFFSTHPRKCTVCPRNRRIDLHHLTYDRLGEELDSDLMPLCKVHHELIEEAKDQKRIGKHGDVVELRRRTLEILCPRPVERPIYTPQPIQNPFRPLTKKERKRQRKEEARRKHQQREQERLRVIQEAKEKKEAERAARQEEVRKAVEQKRAAKREARKGPRNALQSEIWADAEVVKAMQEMQRFDFLEWTRDRWKADKRFGSLQNNGCILYDRMHRDDPPEQSQTNAV